MTRRMTMEIYLTTGQTVQIKCVDFEAKYSTDPGQYISSYTIEGHKPGHTVHIAPMYVAGFRRIK